MTEALRPPPSPEALERRTLSLRRRQLVEMIAMEKTRLKQALDPAMAASHKAVIALLAEERARVEAAIEAAIKAEPADAGRLALLQTIPGVGPAVAATLICDLPELGALDRKQVASLAGLAPHTRQSGTLPASAHVQGGRPCVRAALYLAALSAARSDAGFKTQYQAMRATGKPAKVALIAIARKLVVAANAIAKNKTPWTPPLT
jgi:transposase